MHEPESDTEFEQSADECEVFASVAGHEVHRDISREVRLELFGVFFRKLFDGEFVIEGDDVDVWFAQADFLNEEWTCQNEDAFPSFCLDELIHVCPRALSGTHANDEVSHIGNVDRMPYKPFYNAQGTS